MNRLKLWVFSFGLFCSITTLAGESRYVLNIDATQQQGRPPRGRGPFPGSAFPGHSEGFPIRLDLKMPTGKLNSNVNLPIDFIITNIGVEPIKLPCSPVVSNTPTHMLTLYLTTDAPPKRSPDGLFPFQTANAELDGQSDDPQTFYLLDPGKTIRVRASAIFGLDPGTHSVTAHAELLGLSEGKSKGLGTAESVPVERVFEVASPNAR